MSFNWHKHPDGISRPSGGDISEAQVDIDAHFPGRFSHFWGIVNRISDREVQELQNSKNTLIFSKQDFGGVHNYALRAYNYDYRKVGRSESMKRLTIECPE